MKQARIIGASTLLAVLVAAGCGKKSGDTDGGDKKPGETKSVEAKGADLQDDEAITQARLEAKIGMTANPVPTDAANAFNLGHRIALIRGFMITKKQDQIPPYLNTARELAARLGVDRPSMPAGDDGEKLVMSLHDQLEAKKGKRVAADFALAFEITDQMVGAALKVDIRDRVGAIARLGRASDLPESEWRSFYDELKQRPDPERFEDLERGLQGYLDKQ